MHKTKSSLLAVFLLCAVSAMAVPHRWVAEVSRPVAEEVFAFQGETIEFYPEITAYGEPFIADAYQLHYQTNGMGGLFFSGAITTNLPVLFTPSMDIGATSYSFFVESTNSVGLCFRSFGTIRMKKSPGFSPNTIPLPVSRIDFASTVYTNAPWLLTESDPGIPSAVSNAVAQAGTNAQAIASAAQSNAVAIAGTNAQAIASAAQSNAINFSSTNKTLRLFDPADANRYIDGAGNKCVVSNFYTMTFSADFKNVYGNPPPQSSYIFTNTNYETFSYTLSTMPYNYWSFQRTALSGFSVECHIGLGVMPWLPTTNQYVLTVSNSPEYGTAFITHTATTNVIDSVAFSSSLSRYLTNETDRVSLRAWHYGSSDIVESPSSWFTFNAEWQTITAYVNPANGADVVIPWAIDGVEVKWIGSSAFKDAAINSVIAPKTLTSLDPDAFKSCTMKTAVFPSVSYIDEQALDNCSLLNSITWGSDAPDVEEIDYLFTDSNIVTNYVNSLTAVGWGDTLGGRPVIRMGINIGSLTLGGVTKSAWPAASSGAPAVWTNMVWGAAGTNATYRMYWDITNGTFAVEEIIP